MKTVVFLTAIFVLSIVLLPSQAFADCVRIDSAETFHKKGSAFLRITPRPDLYTFHLESFIKIEVEISENRQTCFLRIVNFLKIYVPTNYSAKDWEIAIQKALEGAYMERIRDNSPYRSHPIPQYRGELSD